MVTVPVWWDGGMALDADATLGDAGEFGLISELVEIFDGDDHVLVGPGDDAAVLRIKHGHVVVSTDLMVEGRHFRRDWASAADVGHRAAAQTLSDINAMGGTARHLTIGLAAPADLPVAWRGQPVEVHAAPTRRGPVSVAVRWHGAALPLLAARSGTAMRPRPMEHLQEERRRASNLAMGLRRRGAGHLESRGDYRRQRRGDAPAGRDMHKPCPRLMASIDGAVRDGVVPVGAHEPSPLSVW